MLIYTCAHIHAHTPRITDLLLLREEKLIALGKGIFVN